MSTAVEKTLLPCLAAKTSSVAEDALLFCVNNCDHATKIHHPECLSNLWNSAGELVVPQRGWRDSMRELVSDWNEQ